MTIYIYSNEDGKQVDALDGTDNADCEAKANDKWGYNDYHWSYSDQPVSNAVGAPGGNVINDLANEDKR